MTHDYTRKRYVVHSEIMLPAHAPPEYADRSILWNSVEWAETDRNAQLAREIEFSLPAELNHEQHLSLIRKYVQKNFVDAGMCADFALHDKRDGNPHAHIQLTMRAIREDGTWAPKSRLVYNLDEKGERIPANQKGRWKNHKEDYVDWNNRENGKKWRVAVAEAINEALHAAGIEHNDVDPRTYAEQGSSRIPTIYEGSTVRALEQKGMRTDVGNQNRAIRDWNKQADQMEARLSKLNGWARYEAAEEKLRAERGLVTVDPGLRNRLMEAAFSTVTAQGRISQGKKARQLKNSMGMGNIMYAYNIKDAASFQEACTQVYHAFYTLRHDLKETDQLLSLVDDRLNTMEQYKRHKSLYQLYWKQSDRKRAAFYEEHVTFMHTFRSRPFKHGWDMRKRIQSLRRANILQKRITSMLLLTDSILRQKQDAD